MEFHSPAGFLQHEVFGFIRMEELISMEEKWGQLRLNDEKSDSIVVGEDFPPKVQLK